LLQLSHVYNAVILLHSGSFITVPLPRTLTKCSRTQKGHIRDTIGIYRAHSLQDRKRSETLYSIWCPGQRPTLLQLSHAHPAAILLHSGSPITFPLPKALTCRPSAMYVRTVRRSLCSTKDAVGESEGQAFKKNTSL